MLLSIAGIVVSVFVLVSSATQAAYVAANAAWTFLFALSMPQLIGTLEGGTTFSTSPM
jgi:hypothetical protein